MKSVEAFNTRNLIRTTNRSLVSSLSTSNSFAFRDSTPQTKNQKKNNSLSFYHTTTALLTNKNNNSNSDDSEKKEEENTMSTEEIAAKKAAAEYILSSEDGEGPATVFDKILSGEWSSDKVHEDDLCYAFRDIAPQAPTHILVIPKKRDGLTKLSNAREDQKGILGHLMYVAKEIGKKECPKGFRIIVNDGEDGAQSVYHLHVHVMGGRQMKWPPG